MNINKIQFEKVVAAAKAKAANHPEWLRAIEKASAAILDGSMIVTTLVSGALVTTPGGTYTANGACDCAARTKHCYHRAGARLMAIYEAEPEPIPAPCSARYCGDRDLQHLDACEPHIERSVERDIVTRRRVKVTRCDGWTI